MLLAKVNKEDILDLDTGILYSYDEKLRVIFPQAGENSMAVVFEGDYAQALWAYLESMVEVSPESTPASDEVLRVLLREWLETVLLVRFTNKDFMVDSDLEKRTQEALKE